MQLWIVLNAPGIDAEFREHIPIHKHLYRLLLDNPCSECCSTRTKAPEISMRKNIHMRQRLSVIQVHFESKACVNACRLSSVDSCWLD